MTPPHKSVYWVRHGPTHAKAFAGWRDIPADLSDTAAIARVQSWLPAQAVCVSSDLVRARDTATAVAPSQIRLADEFGLREFDFGEWDGRHWADVADTHPDLSRAYWETPGDVAAPGGESWNQAAARVSGTIDRLLDTHDSVIAVAHFGAILTQVQRALAVTPHQALGHKIDNLSLTQLDRVDGVWRAVVINQVP